MDTLNSVISIISPGAYYVLPMGLSSSPRIFTIVMKPPLAYFRQKGCTVSGYIDDFFIQENDFRECYSSLEEAVLLFLQLGFHVHPERSVLIPSQSLNFLGFNLNSVSMTVALTQKKMDQLEPLCTEAMNGEDLSIRFVAKVIGKVVPALPGVEFGRCTIVISRGINYMPYQQIKGIMMLLCNYLLLQRRTKMVM